MKEVHFQSKNDPNTQEAYFCIYVIRNKLIILYYAFNKGNLIYLQLVSMIDLHNDI